MTWARVVATPNGTTSCGYGEGGAWGGKQQRHSMTSKAFLADGTGGAPRRGDVGGGVWCTRVDWTPLKRLKQKIFFLHDPVLLSFFFI
ncbi:hypothetical protein U1Q18_020299 [Sarracenia purpurea var. burkii]